MLRSIAFGLSLLAATFTVQADTAQADDAAAADAATLIVYRGDETVRSRRINMDVYVAQDSIGRLKVRDAVVHKLPAGSYTIDTSIPGTEGRAIELRPGQTHYVLIDTRVKGTRVDVQLEEVEEQVARNQQPSLDQLI